MATINRGPSIANYKVLVAVAGDETGDWALLEGARLIEGKPSAEFHVVLVIGESDAPSSGDGIESLERRLDKAPQKLEQRIERMWPSAAATHVYAHIRPGTAANMILQTASDIDADVIVVGSHRRTGLQRLALGSVAERVVKSAHCPVLVAVAKNYDGTEKSRSVEPPCADCVQGRQDSEGASYWCARHSGDYHSPHVYQPTGRSRTSVMPTY